MYYSKPDTLTHFYKMVYFEKFKRPTLYMVIYKRRYTLCELIISIIYQYKVIPNLILRRHLLHFPLNLQTCETFEIY